MDFIIQFLSSVFGERLATLLGAMIPLIELKGSIVFARLSGLGFLEGLIFSYLGSTAVFFIAFFLFKPIINLLKRIKIFNLFALAVEDYFAQKTKNNCDKDFSLSKKILFVFIFVAVPLPLTGVWTGSVIALFLGLNFRQSFLPIALSNLIAGVIISVLAELCLTYLNIILLVMLIIALVLFIVFLVKISIRIKNIKNSMQN